MISVIVPIYNVEPYLRQCINSIVSQTYTDLEILLIDDGSTDGSGAIVDSYDDPRIRVFHTENRGLSAARNLGLDHAHGDFISFVDADDWIDKPFFEHAVTYIGDADIICFGSAKTDNLLSSDHEVSIYSYTGMEALDALLTGKILNAAWNKVYRKGCFSSLLFPTGRICEDTATTYKLLMNASLVVCTDEDYYHYRRRPGSITQTHDKKNIIDFWSSVKERFIDCKDIVNNDARHNLYNSCAVSAFRTWAWRNTVPGLKDESAFYFGLTSFAKDIFPLSVPLRFSVRIGICLVKIDHPLSYGLANTILKTHHYLKGKHFE